nr:MAG TPA: hypothetical protein [Caudoviricetes sp.]
MFFIYVFLSFSLAHIFRVTNPLYINAVAVISFPLFTGSI